MAISNYANAFETTLTGPLGPTGLVLNVESTTGGPSFTSPGAYLVINPQKSASREYVFCDGGSTSNTITISAIGNRYLDGSAAPSGLTHAEGSVVWGGLTKQLLDEFVAEFATKANVNHTTSHQSGGSSALDSYYTRVESGKLDTYTEKIVTASVSGTHTVDLSVGVNHTIDLNGDTTISFSNWDASRLTTVQLRLTHVGAGRTVSWGGNVVWPDGVTPALSESAGKVDRLAFQSWNGGSTIEGFLIATGMS